MNKTYNQSKKRCMLFALSVLTAVSSMHAAPPSIESILNKRTLNAPDISVLTSQAQKIENFYNNKKLDDSFVSSNEERIATDYKQLMAIRKKISGYGAGRQQVESAYKSVMKAWESAPAAGYITQITDAADAGRTFKKPEVPTPSTPPVIVVTAPKPEEQGIAEGKKALQEKLNELNTQLQERYTDIGNAIAWAADATQSFDLRKNNGVLWLVDYLRNPEEALKKIISTIDFSSVSNYESDAAFKKSVADYTAKIDELKKKALEALKTASLNEFKKGTPDTFKETLFFALAAQAIDSAKDKAGAVLVVVYMQDYIKKEIKRFYEKTTTAEDKKKIVDAIGYLIADSVRPLKNTDFIMSDGVMSKEDAKQAKKEGMYVFLAKKLGMDTEDLKNQVEKMYKDYRTNKVVVAESEEKETAARENKALAQTDDAGFKARVELAKALFEGKEAGRLWGTTQKYVYKDIYKTELPAAVLATERGTFKNEKEAVAAWNAMSDADKNAFRKKYKLVEVVLKAQGKTSALDIINGIARAADSSFKMVSDKDARFDVINQLQALDIPEQDTLYFMKTWFEELYNKNPHTANGRRWTADEYMGAIDIVNQVKDAYKP